MPLPKMSAGYAHANAAWKDALWVGYRLDRYVQLLVGKIEKRSH
jgi:hypothetical protein